MDEMNIEGWPTRSQAGGLAGIGQPVPAEHAFAAHRQVVLVRLDQLEEIFEVIVQDVVWTSFLPWRSMTQTYIWRACRSIPQLNSVVDV